MRAACVGVRVARAVFPLHRLSGPFLTTGERDELWGLFQVPVYAMLLDARGRVIGYECEVQEGFHLAGGYGRGFRMGTVATSLCECGRPGPRFLPKIELEPVADEVLYEHIAPAAPGRIPKFGCGRELESIYGTSITGACQNAAFCAAGSSTVTWHR